MHSNYLFFLLQQYFYLCPYTVRQSPFTMNKAKQYAQKFRNKWLNESLFKIWLKPVIGNDTKAYSKFCKSILKAKYQDLKLCCETKKHKRCLPTQTNTPDCFRVKRNDSSQIEASIAMFVTSHCAI